MICKKFGKKSYWANWKLKFKKIFFFKMKILNDSFNKKIINKPNQTSKLHFFVINQILKDHHCSATKIFHIMKNNANQSFIFKFLEKIFHNFFALFLIYITTQSNSIAL